MKLERLHLKAFGGFSDRVLDFSGGNQGLHLILGPNEAGKSTTLRAITQLLYGIETRTTDDFLHRMTDLRIGATLSNGKDALSFFRRKGNKATLLAQDEKTPLPDDALIPYLGGVDAEAFKNLFGLSHELLRSGGKALVQGEGDVGQALFSAAAGMGQLRALLSKLEEDAGELFKPTGSKPRINSALARCRDLRKAVKEAQLPTRAWEAIEASRREVETKRTALDGELREARAEQSRLKRIQRALPLVSQRAALQEQLVPLAGAVLLPDDFPERRMHHQNIALKAGETRAAASGAIAALREELAPLQVNEALLAREEAIRELHEQYGANKKAMNDLERERLPELARLRAEAERTLGHLRPHWTLEQAEDLRLAPGQKQRLQELSRRGESCRAALSHASAAREKLLRQREQAARDLALLDVAHDTTAVEQALKRVRALGDGEAQLREQHARIDDLRAGIAAGIARLGCRSGTMEDLEMLPAPEAASIERFRVELDGAARDLAAAEKEEGTLREALRQAEADLEAYQRQYHAPSLDTMEALRRDRQQGWLYARAAWESATPPKRIDDPAVLAFIERLRARYPGADDLADTFAALVDDADGAADRLRNEAERVARRAQLETAAVALREQCEAVALARVQRADGRATIEAAWRAAWAGAGIEPLPPGEMAEWKKKHETLLREIGELRAATQSAELLRARVEECRSQLRHALQVGGMVDVDADAPLAPLADRAESWVARQREAAQQRAHLEKSIDQHDRSGLVDADAALSGAREAESQWRADWAALMEALGARAEASAEEALALVEAIEDVLGKHGQAMALQQRIDAILRDDQAFRKALHQIVSEVGHDASAGESVAVAALYQELQRNRDAQAARARLAKQLREEEARLHEAETSQARAQAELAALCAEARVDNPGMLPGAERASAERQRLESALRETESRLMELASGAGLVEFLDMAAVEDPDTIGPALTEVEERIEALDIERSDLLVSLGEIKAKLAQMDGGSLAADAAAELQALLAGIAEDAEAYARLRVAAFALSRAIERYRAANQEPLLARAGEIFQTLTLGSFTGLRADLDERDHHALFGVRAENGALVGVAGMSEGSADQLYLALRIASLERHLERHAPVPFILDDVLVNFDDDRAAAALEVLDALSERTQVIYFTHHQHLVELAKATVRKKRLHVHGIQASIPRLLREF